jgi:hypothetical protein
MSEVMVVGPLYEVIVTEYEAGWGQRSCPEETKIFTTESEAKAYAKSCESGTYELYWRATVRKFG